MTTPGWVGVSGGKDPALEASAGRGVFLIKLIFGEAVGVCKAVKLFYEPHWASNARSRFDNGPRWRGGCQRAGGTRYHSRDATVHRSETRPAAIAGVRTAR